jgi:IclR family mhp operon transcriptional activator
MSEVVIQPIARAFNVLRALNRRPYATLQQLHDDTALPKSTIHRILATLRQEGYIARDPVRSIYRLTAKVRSLSSGFGERSLITDIGADIITAVTREIRWPLAIGTLEGTEIVVRYSTMPDSPYAVRNTTVDRRHSLLASAMGTAYLAYCSPRECESLLVAIAKGEGSIAEMARDASLVNHILSKTRERGFGLRQGTHRDESATMAVPVSSAGRVMGVISLTMFRNSLTASALRRYPPILQDVARSVANRIANEPTSTATEIERLAESVH